MKALCPVAPLQMVLWFLLATLLLTAAAPAALALPLPPDDYLGDASIYTGVPSERPKPNVLFIIDTSRATLSVAAGAAYKPTETYVSPFPFINDHIYTPGQDGKFDANSQEVKSGNTALTLANVTCTSTYLDTDGVTPLTVDVHNVLATYGTYSGAGTTKFPNLAGTGACASAPMGQVYATGHYLNYLNSTSAAAAGNIIIRHSYVVWEKVKGVWVNTPYTNSFKLIKNIDVAPFATADMEPGVGVNKAIYWSLMPTGTMPTHEITGGVGGIGGTLTAIPSPLPVGYTIQDGWQVGASYYSALLDPTKTNLQTQRYVFWDALSSVINAASSSVKFGFLTYNPANQGAVLGAHVKDYAGKEQQLIGLLPGMFTVPPIAGAPTCTQDPVTKLWTDCTDLIASGPNRPASEALFDAGWYLRATYPTTNQKVSSKMTVQTDEPNPCGYNHIIYLTNGLPNQDTNPTVGQLGDRDKDNVGTEADEDSYGAGSHYIDDVAWYLNKEADLNNDGKYGDVVTHVVLAFQNEDELMKNTAGDGGGGFYNVFDTQGLKKALLNILANIVKEADTSFVAPVVPASSTNRTRSGERVYLGLFKPQTDAAWHGNLKKYKLSPGNDLLDKHGNPATNKSGDFVYSQSYWGTGTGKVVVTDPSIEVIRGAEGNRYVVSDTFVFTPDANGNPQGVPNPDPMKPGNSLDGGDGGIVNAGGAGGELLARGDRGELRTRKIFTQFTPVQSGGSPIYLRTQDLAGGPVLYGLNPQQLGYSDDAIFTADENLKRSQLIDFMYGFNSYGTTYFSEGQALPRRAWILGDILHSKPLVRSYWKYKDNPDGVTESTCYNNTYDANGFALYNSTMIYVGVNDGMLHAFNDCDGSEEWAFVPPILLDKLQNLSDGTHEFYMDASPVTYVYDANDNGNIESGDKVIMAFGMRRGGGNAYLKPDTPRGAYYMLDVTDPRNPQYLGEINSLTPGFGEMGETWSQPIIDWVQDGTTAKLAMFIGAGYDNNEDRRWGNTQGFPVSTWSDNNDFSDDTDTTIPTSDGADNAGAGVTSDSDGGQLYPKGRGIFIVELARIVPSGSSFALDTTEAGKLVKSFTGLTGMTYSFPSEMTVLDWEGSDFVDRIYAADTGGQVWRFDVKDTDTTIPGNDKTKWSGHIVFKANPGYTEGSPDGTVGRKFFYRPDVGKDGADALLIIGSGDREHPLNKAVDDRLYMIRDKGQTIAATEANLKDLTSNRLQESSNLAEVEGILTELSSETNYGWYVRLEGSGEKMLAEPVLFFGDVLYTTYKPLPAILDPCEVGNLGYAQLYHMNYLKATAVVNYDDKNDTGSVPNDMARGKEGEILRKTDRVVTLGEGIPSGIVVLIDKSGKVSLKVAASGRLTDIKGRKINTYYPLYWTETILHRD